jgi:hypothetical protein
VNINDGGPYRNQSARVGTVNPGLFEADFSFEVGFEVKKLEFDVKEKPKSIEIASTNKSFLVNMRNWFFKLVGTQPDQSLAEIFMEANGTAPKHSLAKR